MLLQIKTTICIFLLGVCSLNAANLDLEQFDLDIAAQSTDKALLSLADKTGIHIIFAADNVEQKKSNSLNKKITISQALKTLLKNTGLTYRVTPDNLVIIKKQASLTNSYTEEVLDEDKQSQDEADENIITVTGKRVVRRDRTNSIEPTLVYDTQFFQRFEPANLRDMLRRVPGVLFSSGLPSGLVVGRASNFGNGGSGADSISARGFDAGNGGLQVLINGRRPPGNGFDSGFDLSSLPAEIIQKIEVIRSPTALINSEGTGLTINVILKNGADIPVNESYNWRATVKNSKGQFGGDLSLSKTGNLSDNSNYFVNITQSNQTEVGRSVERLTDSFNDYYDGFVNFISVADRYSKRDSESLSLNANINTEFDNGSTLGLRTYIIDNESERFSTDDQNIETIDDFILGATSVNESLRVGFSAEYLHQLSDNITMDVGLSYGRSKNENDFAGDQIKRDEPEPEELIPNGLTSSSSRVRDEIKLDVKFDILMGDIHNLKLGFVAETVDQDSNSFNSGSVNVSEGGATTEITDHTEKGLDFFVSYAIELTDSLAFEAGNRYESTDYEFVSNFTNNVLPESRSDAILPFNLGEPLRGIDFGNSGNNPSAHLRWKIAESHQLRLSWARTVEYPNFENLAPILSDLNIIDNRPNQRGILSASIGSPDLNPERSNGFDLSYDFDFADSGIIGLSIYQKETKDEIRSRAVRREIEMRRFISDLDLLDAATMNQLGSVIGVLNVTYNSKEITKTQGAELDFSIPMALLGLPNFSLSSNISYAERKKSNVPETFYQTSANVTFDHLIESWDLTYGVSYNYTSNDIDIDIFDVPEFAVFIDSSRNIRDPLVNLFVEKRLSDTLLVRLTVDNVLDGQNIVEDNFTSIYDEDGYPDYQPAVFETRAIEQADPTYSLTFRGSF